MRLIDLDTLKQNLCGDCAMNFPKECRQIGCTKVDKQDILEALRIPIIDAVPVERDIPKAPTDQELEEDGYGAWGSLYGRCPNCRESVYEEQNYCEKCGQRLDWGNDDPNGFNEETVQALIDATEGKNMSKVYETLDDMFADMETDCVPVIRCRDCKYHKTESYQEGRYVFTFCERDRERRIFDMNDDDYCSNAERREECSR